MFLYRYRDLHKTHHGIISLELTPHILMGIDCGSAMQGREVDEMIEKVRVA